MFQIVKPASVMALVSSSVLFGCGGSKQPAESADSDMMAASSQPAAAQTSPDQAATSSSDSAAASDTPDSTSDSPSVDSTSGAAASRAESKRVERVAGVADTIALFKEKDPSIQKFFDRAAAYVVFPTMSEGAFLVGGASGQGEAYRDGQFVGLVSVREVSVGAQVGGQRYAEIVFFETPRDFKALTDGSFEFKADWKAVASKLGAGQNATFNEGIAAFFIATQGLMARAAVAGQKFTFIPAE